MADENIRHRSTTGTRLTPRWLLDLAVNVMGKIDLDPCAESGPPFNVPATTHYTKADDCVTKKWAGRIFCNPPYGERRGVDRILAHLVREYDAGRVTDAVVILPVDTSTRWWRILGDRFPWCGLHQRVTFDGLNSGAGFPSAVFYLGLNLAQFRSSFAQYGTVYVPLETWGTLL